MKSLNLYVISLILGVIATACSSENKEYFITSELSSSLQKYDELVFFDEGMFCAVKGNKHGFVNINGEEVVPCKYDYAEPFSEGLAKVKLNGKYGYVNTKGVEVIPCKYD